MSNRSPLNQLLAADATHRMPGQAWFVPQPSRMWKAGTWSVCRVAAGFQRLCGDRCTDGFAILIYHRVAEYVPGVKAPTLNVTPERLRQQLAGLLARGFECWSLHDLIQAQRESRTIPPNAFAITFDDGYENNYTHAWPILRELNVPATIFLATKYLDTDRPFPFDDWPAAGSARVAPSAWRPLSLAQCDEMSAGDLIELGAHTHSHERFLGRPDAFRSDMQICLDVLRDRFGIERPTFAFPYGDKSQELVDAARELGVACCLSTRQQRVRPGDDPYEWGRFYVASSDSSAVLAAKLSGWYTTVVSAGKKLARPLTNLVAGGRGPSRQSCDGTYRESFRAERSVPRP